MFVLAGLSFVLKVVVVPLVLLHLLREAEVDLPGSQRFGVASAVLLGVAVSVFAFLAVGSVHIGGSGAKGLPVPALGAALATVLVSFVLVMYRADVISQSIGFFSMEMASPVPAWLLLLGCSPSRSRLPFRPVGRGSGVWYHSRPPSPGRGTVRRDIEQLRG